MADALGTPNGVVSDEDHRIDNAGLIAAQTSSLAVRTGVMWGPGTTALVTGTSATGTMTYSIALHHWVTTRGTADGIYLGTLEAATTVATTAAPGSNSRYDVIWGKQNDTGSTVSADTGTTAPLYGVTQGTAAVSPTKPSIPTGAEELGYAIVAAGATSTNGAGVTITNSARQTVARGARIPVRSQTEEDALTQFAGLEVYRIDTGIIKLSNGTAFTTIYPRTLDYALAKHTSAVSQSLSLWQTIGVDTLTTEGTSGTYSVATRANSADGAQPARYALIIGRAGLYALQAHAAFNAVGPNLRLIRNPAGTIEVLSAGPSAGASGTAGCSATVRCASGDAIAMQSFHSSAYSTSASATAVACNLTATRVGE